MQRGIVKIQKMINFHEIITESKTDHNPNLTYTPENR